MNLFDIAVPEGPNFRLPAGEYEYDETLQFPVQPFGGMKFRGEGRGQTVVTYVGSESAVQFGDGGELDSRYQFLEDLTLKGTSYAVAGVRFNHSRKCGLKRVRIQDFTKTGTSAVHWLGGKHNYFHTLDDVDIWNVHHGLRYVGTSWVGGNSNRAVNVHLGVVAGIAIILDNVTSDYFERVEINGSVNQALLIRNASAWHAFNKCTLDGPDFAGKIEANTTGTTFINCTGLTDLIDNSASTVYVGGDHIMAE